MAAARPDGIPFKIHPEGAVNIRSAVRPRRRKPAFGTVDGMSYAVNVESLDSNDFFKKPFGRQIDDMKKIRLWMETTRSGHAGAKGKATMPAVKRWVRENQPAEFYAKWKADSSMYKDDSVEIRYKVG